MKNILRLLRLLFIFHLSSFIFACSSPTPIPLSSASSLFVFRFNPPALLEFDSHFALARELPLNLPCPLIAAHAAPRGRFLALEMECANGPLVQIVDVTTDEVKTPYPSVDSHFLAWGYDDSLYLRVDALGNTRIVQFDLLKAKEKALDLPLQTYDLAPRPGGNGFASSLSNGIGYGSQLRDGRRILATEPNHIISFARWSPNGTMLAYIRFPDSAIPFPLGELWVMNADGSGARALAPADAGRGYAAAWSPDSTRLAYVGRDNPDDPAADQSAGALVSNIYIVEIASGQVTQVTRFEGTLVEAPVWSADGTFLAFSVVTLNDTIAVWIADLATGQVRRLETAGPACCPAWIRK
ncbi:MAG: hypothetical protein AB1750_00155 [Chloroflexota bacterium]